MSKKQFFLLIGISLFLALLFQPKTLWAQQTLWTDDQPIPGYVDSTQPPYLVADQNHTVHAFSWQGKDEEDYTRAIVYSSWHLDRGWSQPVDIMLSPDKYQARVKGVFLDPDSNMHMIFFGGDEVSAEIFYSRAPAALAGNAQAWSKPIIIGDGAITPDVAALIGDKDGNLLVIYAGNLGNGRTLYWTRSHDYGDTWSDPELFYSTYVGRETPFDLDIYLGESGKVHVVWSIVNFRGQIVSSFYANLETILAAEWSEPQIIAKNVSLGVAVPAVIEYQDTIFILYNNGLLDDPSVPVDENPVVHWFKRSFDGGKTWTEPIRPFLNHFGRNGFFSFVIDGNGELRVFFGQRIPRYIDNRYDMHGMWYATWKNDRWVGPDPVITGRFLDTFEEAFDPYDARAVVSQGNVLLVTWRTDPGRKKPGVWYSYQIISAAQEPVVPLPTPIPTETPLPTPTLRPLASTPTSIADNPPIGKADPAVSSINPNFTINPGFALLLGTIPVILIILGAAIYQSRRQKKPLGY